MRIKLIIDFEISMPHKWALCPYLYYFFRGVLLDFSYCFRYLRPYAILLPGHPSNAWLPEPTLKFTKIKT